MTNWFCKNCPLSGQGGPCDNEDEVRKDDLNSAWNEFVKEKGVAK